MKLINDFYSIVAHQEESAESFSYTITLNPSHYIYQAHFPGNPITPGVCMLEIATELLEKKLEKRLSLSVVNNVKYLSIISPNEVENVLYIFTVSALDDGCKVKVMVKNDEKIFAKISLTYTHVQ